MCECYTIYIIVIDIRRMTAKVRDFLLIFFLNPQKELINIFYSDRINLSMKIITSSCVCDIRTWTYATFRYAF